MRDERAEMTELLRRLGEAVKLVIDGIFGLLGLLLGLWLDSRQMRATQPAQLAQMTDCQLLTIDEVARRLDVSERAIRDLIQQKAFPDRRIGRAQRFDWADVDAWTKRHRQTLETKRQGVVR